MRAGFTQAGLAASIGKAPEVYGRPERGKMLPSLHLRSPGGGCIGVPDVCHQRPVTCKRMVELAQRAEELWALLLYHPLQRLKPEDFPEARLTIVDKLGSALSLAECLNSLIVSLLDDHAVLTLEDMVSMEKIGGNVVKQIRALEKILLGWVGTDDL